MHYTFKTNCPKCGGKKKWKTKVDLNAGTISKAKCYKCGHYSPAQSLDRKVRATFELPSEDDVPARVAA